MVQKDKREHYYYVTKHNGVCVVKSFNKKLMRKNAGVTDNDIVGRFRHFDAAMTFAAKYSAANGYTTRPFYLSLTGNDIID